MKTLSVVGRLGNDPELRQAGGTSILKASVACDYQKKAADGSYDRHTMWIRCVVFGRRAESLAKVLTKGMRIAASGDMQIDEYTDKKSGEKRFSVEVIANDIEPLFDKKADGGERREQHRDTSAGGWGGGGFEGAGSTEDDIPFRQLRGEI